MKKQNMLKLTLVLIATTTVIHNANATDMFSPLAKPTALINLTEIQGQTDQIARDIKKYKERLQTTKKNIKDGQTIISEQSKKLIDLELQHNRELIEAKALAEKNLQQEQEKAKIELLQFQQNAQEKLKKELENVSVQLAEEKKIALEQLQAQETQKLEAAQEKARKDLEKQSLQTVNIESLKFAIIKRARSITEENIKTQKKTITTSLEEKDELQKYLMDRIKLNFTDLKNVKESEESIYEQLKELFLKKFEEAVTADISNWDNFVLNMKFITLFSQEHKDYIVNMALLASDEYTQKKKDIIEGKDTHVNDKITSALEMKIEYYQLAKKLFEEVIQAELQKRKYEMENVLDKSQSELVQSTSLKSVESEQQSESQKLNKNETKTAAKDIVDEAEQDLSKILDEDVNKKTKKQKGK